MLMFVSVFVSFHLFNIIENRVCTGVDGDDCCFGFSLNKATGKCEKCSIGYIGINCSKTCSYPFYGEDCQSICLCPEHDCHITRGCFPNVQTVSNQQQSSAKPYSRKIFTTSSSVFLSNETVSYPLAIANYTTDKNKLSHTTFDYLPKSNNLLNNIVIIIFFGIFVLFFSLFVITYIFLKCFRKTANAIVIQENELQAQYQSLNFEATEPEQRVPSEQQGRVITDSAYLSPVFSCSETSESHVFLHVKHKKDDILRETSPGGQIFIHDSAYADIEPYHYLDNQNSNDYNEIPESNVLVS